jgi:hypothetical protein
VEWRRAVFHFFVLGIQLGLTGCIFTISLAMLVFTHRAGELSSLYYPIFRCALLLSLCVLAYGGTLLLWKRHAIHFAAVLGVDEAVHHFHYVIRSGFAVLSSTFVLFVGYMLTITLRDDMEIEVDSVLELEVEIMTGWRDVWPLVTIVGSVGYLCAPFDWMRDWSDRLQRRSLLRLMGRVLRAPFCEYNFAHNFLADVLCSLSLACSDVAYSACIYVRDATPRRAEMTATFDCLSPALAARPDGLLTALAGHLGSVPRRRVGRRGARLRAPAAALRRLQPALPAGPPDRIGPPVLGTPHAVRTRVP